MMPTYEDLETNIAIALCEKDFGKGSCNIKANKGGEQDCVKAECYPTAYAKVMLQALLSSLPAPKGKCPHGCYFAKDTHSGNYMMLLEMKK